MIKRELYIVDPELNQGCDETMKGSLCGKIHCGPFVDPETLIRDCAHVDNGYARAPHKCKPPCSYYFGMTMRSQQTHLRWACGAKMLVS